MDPAGLEVTVGWLGPVDDRPDEVPAGFEVDVSDDGATRLATAAADWRATPRAELASVATVPMAGPPAATALAASMWTASRALLVVCSTAEVTAEVIDRSVETASRTGAATAATARLADCTGAGGTCGAAGAGGATGGVAGIAG